MASILLKGGRVLDPSQNLDAQHDVLIENGVIQKVGKSLPTEGCEVLELKAEQWVVPGLVDMHVHFREPGQTHKEDLRSGSEAAIIGGFTATACMPNTTPVIDNKQTLDFVHQRAKETSRLPIYVIAAATKGLLGEESTEIATLVKAGAVGFSDDGRCVMNAQVMRLILEQCAQYDVPFLCHAEDTNLACHGCMNESAVSTRLGLQGIPNVSESVIVARDIELARLTGVHVHFCHISARESLTLIRAAKDEGLRVTCEVTPHHIALTDLETMTFDGNTKMNPPLRTSIDQQAMIAGLADGTIDAIATDHAPHAPGEKARAFAECPFGVIGLETSVGVTLTTLVHTDKLTPMQWVNAMTTAPAKLLKLPNGQGTLQTGAAANITVIDPAHQWTVGLDDLRSKSVNTPFLNNTLTGQAMLTIAHGEILDSKLKAVQTVAR